MRHLPLCDVVKERARHFEPATVVNMDNDLHLGVYSETGIHSANTRSSTSHSRYDHVLWDILIFETRCRSKEPISDLVAHFHHVLVAPPLRGTPSSPRRVCFTSCPKAGERENRQAAGTNCAVGRPGIRVVQIGAKLQTGRLYFCGRAHSYRGDRSPPLLSHWDSQTNGAERSSPPAPEKGITSPLSPLKTAPAASSLGQ